MATMISPYSPYMYHQQPYMYHQQPYYYPTVVPNNYYTPQPQPQPQPQPTNTVQYVETSKESIPPRRKPRIYREVIVLPTPEPVYRQVRHRMPTPERQVINRTFIQKANGSVVVQQQRSSAKPRTQSRSEISTQSRQSRSRQVHTD